MVFLNILRRQKEKLLGQQQVTIDVKDPESDDNLKEKTGICGFSYFTSLYLCLTLALMVALMCTSVVYLYDEYHQAHHFRGRCGVNIDDMMVDRVVADQLKYSMEQQQKFNEIDEAMFSDMRSFQEDFDIYLDDGHAKINVPDFRDGRRGQFVHDFNINLTAIVDSESQRCFVMPLDTESVLPPRSLMDMVIKMMDGYYNINMKYVRQNMVVVFPALSDLSKIGEHINRECKSYPIYQLEKQTHAISKRSADTVPAKFREFAGNNLQEFDILNFDDIVKYEMELKNSST